MECADIVQSRSNEGNGDKQTLRSVKLTTGKKGQKTELTGKRPLRRRRSALDCSATEEEEESTDQKPPCTSKAFTNYTVQNIIVT